ncbi:MAG: 30S ribosomal protein S12 methylthiotransferase RimO, partial [Actinobacteria bacterium]|nr:30S ribosomal protein S12 methylthiotransferase RimO [Actinomycetota bacterium]
MPPAKKVAIVTLGCARNEVDSEELAGRLSVGGWDLVENAESADAVLVNTCGFIEAAKRESIDTVLSLAGDDAPAVIATGCLAERYGTELAASLPEARAVLGFDDYPEIAARLDAVMRGEDVPAPVPTDRRTLLPLSPVARPDARSEVAPDASAGAAADGSTGEPHGYSPPVPRIRLGTGPVASVKLASGCDRRCAFCAIPRFRGSFVSRTPSEIVSEMGEMVAAGVREVILVSENTTSYGKDLGDMRLLESLLPDLAAGTGVDRIRLSYLQPAEMRPGLVAAIAGSAAVADYFDLSFQHASPRVLRAMRRFGGTKDFLELIEAIRTLTPAAGIRSNVIVGFPGETDEDVDELAVFLEAARLDAVGVFAYSDEDETEAAGLEAKVPEDVIEARRSRLVDLVDELMEQRAAERIGESVRVLVESIDDGVPCGRAAHQGPDDGACFLVNSDAEVGDWVDGQVVENEGV